MSIFDHHIYEYKKGLRGLILLTIAKHELGDIRTKLIRQGIEHIVQPVDVFKVNVFFGDPLCLSVVRNFKGKSLDLLSDEEDFILGLMLGYGQEQQCQRYLDRKKKNAGSSEVALTCS